MARSGCSWFKFETVRWLVSAGSLEPKHDGIFLRICALVHARGELGVLALPRQQWECLLRIPQEDFDEAIDLMESAGLVETETKEFDEVEIRCAMVADSEVAASEKRSADSARKAVARNGFHRNPPESNGVTRIPPKTDRQTDRQTETTSRSAERQVSADLVAALTDEPKAPTPADRVFAHYRGLAPCRGFDPARAKLTAKRRRLIQARLGEGFTVDELCNAISGYRESPHHCGENERNTVYLEIDLMLRDAAHVEAGFKYREASALKPNEHGVIVTMGGKRIQ